MKSSTIFLFIFLFSGYAYHTLVAQNDIIPASLKITNPHYGSMGGFLTFNEVGQQLDSMRLLYPNLISIKDTIIKTNPYKKPKEKKPVWVVRISENPDITENEPKLLFTSLIHANEPMGMMQLIHYMWHLLENSASDPDLQFMLKTRELYFAPVLNPDGYVNNQQKYPNGGGRWRNNLQAVGLSKVPSGIDINRNLEYAFDWNRAEYPFEANEALAILRLTTKYSFTFNINFHSTSKQRYPGFLILPWNHDPTNLINDSLALKNIAAFMSDKVRYRTGKAYKYSFETVIDGQRNPPNGTIEDWMYGERNTMALTVAIASGFWPEKDKIIPLCENLLSLNYRACWSGGCNPVINDVTYKGPNNSDYINPGEDGSMTVNIENLGLASTNHNLLLTLSTADTTVTIQQPNATLPAMEPQSLHSNLSDPFMFSVGPNAHSGQLVVFNLAINIGGNIINRPVELYIGTPVTLLLDTFINLNNWTFQGNWGLIESNQPGKYCITESPNGLYHNYTTYTMINKIPLSFSNIISPFLEFSTIWNIEPAYDFASVHVSTNHGQTWINLIGKGGYFASGEPPVQSDINLFGYDGYKENWIKEKINLKNYSGKDSVFVKFELSTDGWIVEDGWLLDDIKISGYPLSSAYSKFTKKDFFLKNNSPNPFNPSTSISFTILKPAKVTLTIYNVLGQEVTRLISNKHYETGNHSIEWNGKNKHSQAVASGVYFYRLEAGGFSQTKKMLMIR